MKALRESIKVAGGVCEVGSCNVSSIENFVHVDYSATVCFHNHRHYNIGKYTLTLV